MAYKCVEYKVLTVLSKNLHINSLIKTVALCCIRWQSLSLVVVLKSHSINFRCSFLSRLLRYCRQRHLSHPVGQRWPVVRLICSMGPPGRGRVCDFRHIKWFNMATVGLLGAQDSWIWCTYRQQVNELLARLLVGYYCIVGTRSTSISLHPQ